MGLISLRLMFLNKTRDLIKGVSNLLQNKKSKPQNTATQPDLPIRLVKTSGQATILENKKRTKQLQETLISILVKVHNNNKTTTCSTLEDRLANLLNLKEDLMLLNSLIIRVHRILLNLNPEVTLISLEEHPSNSDNNLLNSMIFSATNNSNLLNSNQCSSLCNNNLFSKNSKCNSNQSNNNSPSVQRKLSTITL